MAQPLVSRSISAVLRRFLCQRRLLECLPPLTAARGVYTRDPNRILTRSTILLQDGLDIQELPLVIRKIEGRDFPFTTAMYTGELPRKTSEQEQAFMQQLTQCENVPQVFRLLEVPGEEVTAYSAAFALQRLCGLQAGMSNEIQSFIRKAILNELWETVVRGLGCLGNDTLLGLVQCYLSPYKYEDRHIDAINDEVECRVGDGTYPVTELCQLLDLLSIHAKADQELTNNVWIHLGSRYQELDQTNLKTVFSSLLYLPPSQKFIWKVLDKRVCAVWWKLDAEDVSLILQRMCQHNHKHNGIFSHFGKWILINIHVVSETHLKNILGAYTHFGISNSNLMRALERYVGAKVNKMSKTCIGMIMDYCRKNRHVSPKIFDAVAKDFQVNSKEYGVREMLNTLRPFGQLNYIPGNATQLFLTVEDILGKVFSDFDPASIAELLTSFIYIERFPVNFVRKIFTPHFLTRVREIPRLALRQQTGRYLLEMQAAMLLEFPRHFVKPLDGDSLGLSLTWLESRYFRFHLDMNKALVKLIGSGSFYDVELARNTPHVIDFHILTHKKKILPANQESQLLEDNRLALIGVMPDHRCSNTSHLIGEQAMKRRHLAKLGYTVIEVSYEEFMWRCRSPAEQVVYLQSLLAPLTNLS